MYKRIIFDIFGMCGTKGLPQLLRRLRLTGKKLFTTDGFSADDKGLESLFDGVMSADSLYEIAGKDKKSVVLIGGSRESEKSAAIAGIDFISMDGFSGDFGKLAELLGVSGLFITFEGIDGTGKTTQINLLAQYLREKGHEPVITFEPGGCRISGKIRELVLDREYSEMQPMTEALLYAAARAQHVGEVVLPALNAGKIVLCDRYVDSSVAYQGCGRGLGAENVRRISKFATSGLMPSRTYFLYADPVNIEWRQKKEQDRLESESLDFKSRVENGFEKISRAEPARFVRIDATCPSGEIFDIIRNDIDLLLF